MIHAYVRAWFLFWRSLSQTKTLRDVSVSAQDARLSHHIAHWKHPEFLGASAAGLWEIRAVDGSNGNMSHKKNTPIPSQYTQYTSWWIGFPIWVIIYNNPPPNSLGSRTAYNDHCVNTWSPQLQWSLVSRTISIYINLHLLGEYKSSQNIKHFVEGNTSFWWYHPFLLVKYIYKPSNMVD